MPASAFRFRGVHPEDAGSNGPTSIRGGMLGPLHGGGPIPSMPPTSRVPLPWMTIRHTGAGRPAGHQFVHRIRTEAARARASVTIGQPRGVSELLANHCGEVPWMSTPV